MPNYATQFAALLFGPNKGYSPSFADVLISGNNKIDKQDADVAIDSSAVVETRIYSGVQRSGQDVVDVGGKVFNSIGGPIVLDALYYGYSPTGPWMSGGILISDALFSFPAIGTPGGEVFNLPVIIPVSPPANQIWLKIEVDY